MAPTLVYDDDCGFCTRSAMFVDRHADVTLVGFSELSEEHLERLPPDYERCAHLVTDGRVYSCGQAMERAYELTDRPLSSAFPYLRRIPGYPRVREAGYRLIANNRAAASWLSRRLTGL